MYLLGKERGFNRFKSETEEEFRNRVINAISWYEKAGTVREIKEILKIHGFENIKITPVLKTDSNRWAEFEIRAKLPTDKTNHKALLPIINKIKPTHEKLYRVIFEEIAKTNLYTHIASYIRPKPSNQITFTAKTNLYSLTSSYVKTKLKNSIKLKATAKANVNTVSHIKVKPANTYQITAAVKAKLNTAFYIKPLFGG